MSPHLKIVPESAPEEIELTFVEQLMEDEISRRVTEHIEQVRQQELAARDARVQATLERWKLDAEARDELARRETEQATAPAEPPPQAAPEPEAQAEDAEDDTPDDGVDQSDPRWQRACAVLNALAVAEQDGSFDTLTEGLAISYFQDGFITVKQMSMVCWRARKMGIAYDAKDFDIWIGGEKDYAKIRSLKEFQIKQVMPALTPDQAITVCRIRGLLPWPDEA